MEEQRAHGITRIATKYGLILGVLSFVIFLAGTLPAMRQNRVVSVANTALLIVLMVLAHWEFKRNRGGMMTYPQGLGSGTLLSAWAVLVKCVPMYVYVRYINTEYFAVATRARQAALERHGITGVQAQHAMSIIAPLLTPMGLVVISLIAGVIGGLVVALIVSIFTQKSDGVSYGSRPPG